MKKFQQFIESKEQCPRCGSRMIKHPNEEKAKAGIKQCSNAGCGMNYSPNAPKYKGSWADEVSKRNG